MEEKKDEKVEQSKDNSKKKKVLKYVLNGVVWGLILGFLIYSGLRVIDVKSGYKVLPHHSAVIVSDSMSYVNEANYSYLDKDVQHIMKNDVVTTSNYDSFDEVQKLDVVLYLSESGTLVCHRVIDTYVSNDIPYVVTRGDANNTNDAPVKYELVRGKVTSISGGGGAVLFFQSPYFVLALCGTGFFILLGYLIFSLKTEKKAAGVTEEAIPNNQPEPVVPAQPVSKEQPKPVEQPKQEPAPKETKTDDQVKKPEVEKPAPVKEEPKVVEQPKVENENKPARVNGRFVSKNANQAPAKPASNGSRWTKENNPFANKKRAEGDK